MPANCATFEVTLARVSRSRLTGAASYTFSKKKGSEPKGSDPNSLIGSGGVICSVPTVRNRIRLK